ncbi:MAG TPA: hypothetical protein DEP65_01820 [Ruminococcus sp.]|nr:hypothetical protein [Ruminococcus sp.]
MNEDGMRLNLPLNFKILNNNPLYPVSRILGTAVFFRGHIEDDDLVFDDITDADIEKIEKLLSVDADKETTKNMIKVNLPFDEQDIITGNGEGIWISVSDEIKAKYDADVEDGVLYTGTAENDSVYYRDLSCGDTVLFKLRGEKRAIADMDFLTDKGRITDKQRLLCKLVIALTSNNIEAANSLIDTLTLRYGGVEQGELRAARLIVENRQ